MVVSASSTAVYVDFIDPSTGALNKRFAATSPDELTALLTRARTAQEHWGAKPLGERCALLDRLRDVLLDSRNEIAEVITRETGKPRAAIPAV